MNAFDLIVEPPIYPQNFTVSSVDALYASVINKNDFKGPEAVDAAPLDEKFKC